ncbi:protein DGCR6-like [Watersipora subatra]|uniref:protein DGCR6-like n=1 Tax=Watersipora subatra TaxID=2589382 RepID=UPI00355BAAAB
MSEYQVSNIDPGILATVTDELNKREERQKRQYEFLRELQSLARELPSKFQQRLSSDVLVSLASSLLDTTVFAIVSGSSDIQRMEEQNLFSQRKKLINDLSEEKQKMAATHKERIYKCQSATHNLKHVELQNREELEAFERKKRDELFRYDKTVVEKLDAKVRSQQTTLMKAGVAGFYETEDPEEIRLQMYILDFIARLSPSGI